MEQRKFTIIKLNILLMISIYLLILSIQWNLEYIFVYNRLVSDIVKYDTQVVSEYNKNSQFKNEYFNIFIDPICIRKSTMFSNWNIFKYGEINFIKCNNAEYKLLQLQYWRLTGNLPTLYNFGIRSI